MIATMALSRRETPVSIRLTAEGLFAHRPEALASALVDRPGFFWLDSASIPEGAANAPEARDEGTWSYLSAHPSRILTSKEHFGSLWTTQGDEILGTVQALDLISKELDALPIGTSSIDQQARGKAPPFVGGWLAFFGYDLAREIEKLPNESESDLPFPDLYLAQYPVVLAFDHTRSVWWALGQAPADSPENLRQQKLQDDVRLLLNDAAAAPDARHSGELEKDPSEFTADAMGTESSEGQRIRSNLSKADYEKNVERALEYIAAGDIYQVNLSQRFEAPWKRSPLELYTRLRNESPSSYAALISLGDGRWACSITPELFLSVRGGRIQTRPIKGTRPRGATEPEDRRLSEELADSEKDRAELTMIVDLERNDLGRVCVYGSVQVNSPGALESHPTVFHRTAAITGKLAADATFSKVFASTFPGGSVTGAPKIRAMEIIEELEPVRRGPYCGAIGWIGTNGDLTLNLPIRTALYDRLQETVWYQAGGGIVADSTPPLEYAESLAKAKAFFRAVNGRLAE